MQHTHTHTHTPCLSSDLSGLALVLWVMGDGDDCNRNLDSKSLMRSGAVFLWLLTRLCCVLLLRVIFLPTSLPALDSLSELRSDFLWRTSPGLHLRTFEVVALSLDPCLRAWWSA